jgi:hypothetical protein
MFLFLSAASYIYPFAFHDDGWILGIVEHDGMDVMTDDLLGISLIFSIPLSGRILDGLMSLLFVWHGHGFGNGNGGVYFGHLRFSRTTTTRMHSLMRNSSFGIVLNVGLAMTRSASGECIDQ